MDQSLYQYAGGKEQLASAKRVADSDQGLSGETGERSKPPGISKRRRSGVTCSALIRGAGRDFVVEGKTTTEITQQHGEGRGDIC